MAYIKNFIISFLFSYWFSDLKIWEEKINVFLMTILVFSIFYFIKSFFTDYEGDYEGNVNTSNHNVDFKLSIFGR